jgi:hypothetical protein
MLTWEYKSYYFRNNNYIYYKLSYILLCINTNSSILAGKPTYTIIGTYDLHSFGLQKLMEVGTIIGNKAYSVQYIVDAPRYSDYLPIAQKMIGSLGIKNSTDIGSMPNNSTKMHPNNT